MALSPAAIPAPMTGRRARRIAVCCASGFAALLNVGPIVAAPTPPALVDETCDIEIADPAVVTRLRCARLHVWRDPQRPEQGRFELAVVVRRSATPEPGASPVLLLHGGPGGESTRWLGMGSRDPVPGHDLVAFDMRGGGRSTPRVCEGDSERLMRDFVAADGPVAAAARRESIARECHEAWRAAGFTPTHFGTERNIADAEALREALGVERWLLLGDSYGTSAAAHYVASHPQRIEAAVLDSLYPPDDLVLPVSRMQAGLAERIGADCARDPDSAARFPTFGAATLDAAVLSLDAAPLSVGRGTGALQLDGLGLRQLVAGLAADEAGARAIPLLVDAAQRRDAALLEGPLRGLAAAQGGANLAALLATDCRDRARHHAEVGNDHALQLLAGLPAHTCRDWATPGAAPLWPSNTEVPMLLLAGGYDMFQPDARAVASRIGAAAMVVEVPMASHGVRGAGPCVRELVSTWMAAPDQAADQSCVTAMDAPPFLRDVVPLPGVPQLMAATAPPLLAMAALGSIGVALLAGLLMPALSRMRRGAHPAPRAPRAAAAATASLIVAIAVPAAALAVGPDPAPAVIRFGLPATWGLAVWLLWPAGVLALFAAAWALVDKRPLAATAAAAVLVAVGSCAGLGVLPVP